MLDFSNKHSLKEHILLYLVTVKVENMHYLEEKIYTVIGIAYVVTTTVTFELSFTQLFLCA